MKCENCHHVRTVDVFQNLQSFGYSPDELEKMGFSRVGIRVVKEWQCVRFPKWEPVAPTHYCGEFDEREEE